ncbi:MAG: SRPBCC family protein [Actinomycetota bacterium]
MALRSETHAEIAAGVESAYDYVSNLSRWSEWARGIRECAVSGGGSLQAGARIDQRVKASGAKTKVRSLTVTAVDPPRRLEFSGMIGASPLHWGFELTALHPTRTKAMLWVEIERHGPMRIMPAAMLRKGIRDTNKRELAIIKSKVEA